MPSRGGFWSSYLPAINNQRNRLSIDQEEGRKGKKPERSPREYRIPLSSSSSSSRLLPTLKPLKCPTRTASLNVCRRAQMHVLLPLSLYLVFHSSRTNITQHHENISFIWTLGQSVSSCDMHALKMQTNPQAMRHKRSEIQRF